MGSRKPLQVLVISPHPLVRGGLAAIADTDQTQVVAIAPPVGELCGVDVVVYDLDGLGDGGENLARVLHENMAAVVGMSHPERPDRTRGATALGVNLYVSRDAEPGDLMSVVEAAAARRRGGVAETSGVSRVRRRSSDPAVPDTALTLREVEILRRIGQGRDNEEIASDLYLSINSVKTYIRTAYRRIGVTNRTKAILWLAEHGLLVRGDELGDDPLEADVEPPASTRCAFPTSPGRLARRNPARRLTAAAV